MRLHGLTATAFGPFPHAVEVDFDRLCEAGLFLIHGATGAGKTSLLDAVCFALFADVPGARTRRGLASDHAAEGSRPSVRLDFSVSGRRLRLERSPEYSRPKKRGTGTTRVPPTVTLEEWRGGGWWALSTRHDEVADLLDQLLGMGLAQFAKVVVLPQGDVAAFLRATPEDRRTLLEHLFDISTFTGVEEWLCEERRRTTAQVETLRTAVGRELARLEDLLGTDDSPDWASLTLEALPAELGDQVAHLEAAVLSRLTAADEAAQAHDRASEVLRTARATAQTRERGLRAQVARDAALADADEIASLRGLVDRALAADAVAGHLDGLDTALEEERRCRAAVQAARLATGLTPVDAPGDDSPAPDASGPDDGDPPSGARGPDNELVGLAELLHAGDPVVGDLVRASRAVSTAETALVSARRDVTTAERSLATALAQKQRAETDIASARTHVARLRLAAADQGEAEAASAAAARAVRLAKEVARLTAARALTTPAVLAAREDVLSAQSAVIAARQRRIDGMAAELAAVLAHGAPCPVCGSAEHPCPAVGTEAVTPEWVERVESELLTARTRLSELEREEAVAAARIAALEEQLADTAGEAASPDRADVRLAALSRAEAAAAGRLAASSAALRDLPAAETDAELAEGRLHGASMGVDTARAALVAAETRLETAERALDEHRVTVCDLRLLHAGCPCGPTADLGAAQLQDRHVAVGDAVDLVLAAEARHAEARARRRDRFAAALLAAVERGFPGLEEARSARLAPGVVDRARTRIGEHEQTLAVSAATLAEDLVRTALAGPPPDLEAAATAESVARQAMRAAQSAHSAAETRLVLLRSVHGPVCALVEELGPAAERAAAVKELADAASGVGGGNIYRMRLSSFVLAARLEKVVALANERLQRMDGGRYLLEHSDTRVAGGARSGLDLRVLDQWTGRTRETASLSGGESFMVSLALALGLADAVREESGGADLGTLFVDEGFGSLDEDSLEQVMGVLDGLREGGRAVGVVSHVPDLRARITHQVVVEKTATGSAVSVRTVA